MTLMPPLIKTCLLALLLGALSALPVRATAFVPGPAVSLDLWITWPDESRWDEPEVLLPFPEWRKSLATDDLQVLVDTGFSMVRLPVDPSVFLSPKTVNLREDLFSSLLNSIRLLNAAGLKVMVDLHSIPAGGNRAIGTTQILGDDALFDDYADLVRRMARLIAGEDPSLVALELMNEPVIGCEGADAEEWAAKLLRLHAAARVAAWDHTLVLSGGCWGSAEGLAALDPRTFADTNVLWSFHSYAPFVLTHQGATWAGDVAPHLAGLPYPPYGANAAILDSAVADIMARVDRDASYLRRSGIKAFVTEEIEKIDSREEMEALLAGPFEIAAAWAKKYGIPASTVFLGEFGMIRQEYGNDYIVPPEWRAAYYRDMIALADAYGFSWSLWSYGGAFGVVDEFENRTAEPAVLDVIRARRR